MAPTAESVKKLISALGFIPVDGEADVYNKKYPQHNGYVLRVDFANKAIEYADVVFEDTLDPVFNKSHKTPDKYHII